MRRLRAGRQAGNLSRKVSAKHEVFEGYVYVSGSGQLVIDRHPNDKEHLLARSYRSEQPLHDCRLYLAALFPEEWRGRDGLLVVSRTMDDAGRVTLVQLSFTPRDELRAPPASLGDLPGAPSR